MCLRPVGLLAHQRYSRELYIGGRASKVQTNQGPSPHQIYASSRDASIGNNPPPCCGCSRRHQGAWPPRRCRRRYTLGAFLGEGPPGYTCARGHRRPRP